MKNKVLALVTGLSSLVLLAACSNQQNGLTSTTSSSSVVKALAQVLAQALVKRKR